MTEKKEYITQIENLSAEQIADGISIGIVTFDELRRTGAFDASKQKSVKNILKKKDDDTFASAQTIRDLQNYLRVFPNGSNVSAAQAKMQQLQDDENAEERKYNDRERMLRKIKEDINEYAPDEIVEILSENDLNSLCETLGINATTVKNYTQPTLNFNDIPQNESDIPADYTDIFFWGIPSSGKTCALAAILSTITKDYTMEAPDTHQQFGSTYRTSLINMFRNNIGNLPNRTATDRTQYMPFLFYKRGEKNKRKISFFELSGEVFQYFFEVVNNSQIIDDYNREGIENSFKTLELLLNSNNQKIHYFFIDYNQETKHTEDTKGLTQSNYLEAAAVYFRDRNNIFRKKTDAVYVVITKSDEIKGDNKIDIAKAFLQENFGSFMDVLKNQCQRNSVDFKVKLFSIGDVYFKRICKIDRSYSNDIIQDLLKRVKPVSNNVIKKFFNS
ncbi:MAG: hypothetical protein IPH89_00180 [Bacteroidetes bacterium]|nr:hypothetical protein [Bacteroidota bacterium]